MKKFMLDFLVFLLPIGAICIIADVLITQKIGHAPYISDKTRKAEQILNERNKKYQILILGDSRAESHISPQKIIDYTGLTCKNNGFYAQDIYGIHEFLNFSNLDSTQILLLNISTFNFYDTKAFDIIFNQHFLPYIFGNFWLLNKFKGKHFFDIVFPLVRYTRMLPYFYQIRYTDTIYYKKNGLILFNSLQDTSHKNAFLITENLILESALQKQGINEMFSIINICKQKNIKPVIIFSPYTYVNDTFNFKKNSQLFYKFLKDTLVKQQVTVWDYYNDTSFINQNLFFNWGHLNTNGQVILSEKIAKAVKELRPQAQINYSNLKQKTN